MSPGRIVAAFATVALPLLTGCHTSVGRGWTLLDRHPEEVLRTVRPVGSSALIVRGAALRRLGRLDAARSELLMALSMDERSARGQALLGLVQLQLGHRGAAMKALHRSVTLAPGQICVRRELARLLVWRAWYRVAPGLHQVAEAEQDLVRAESLDPCLRPRVARLRRELKQGPALDGAARCPGIPALRWSVAPPRCGVAHASRQVDDLLRREVLVACHGPRLALDLERSGCTEQALHLWQAMAAEAPRDPRWPLHVAWIHLQRGDPSRAQPFITASLYLSADRGAALIDLAQMLEIAGQPARAGRRAVEALAMATHLEQQLEALHILRRCGSAEQLHQGAQVVLESTWPLPAERLRELVRRATEGGARRTPAP